MFKRDNGLLIFCIYSYWATSQIISKIPRASHETHMITNVLIVSIYIIKVKFIQIGFNQIHYFILIELFNIIFEFIGYWNDPHGLLVLNDTNLLAKSNKPKLRFILSSLSICFAHLKSLYFQDITSPCIPLERGILKPQTPKGA